MTQPPEGVPAPPTPPAGGAAAGADVLVRFIAKIVDGVVLFIIVSIVGLFIRPMLPGPRGFFTPGMSLTGFGIAALVMSIISAVIYLAYLAFLESSRGQTLGKMVLKLQVVGSGGGNPTLEEAVRRNAWVLLGIIPWLGGLLQFAVTAYIGYTIYDSAENVGWHDTFAGGTRVIKVD